MISVPHLTGIQAPIFSSFVFIYSFFCVDNHAVFYFLLGKVVVHFLSISGQPGLSLLEGSQTIRRAAVNGY